MKLALAPIVDQLKAGGLANVEGVLELVATEDVRTLPAFYVVPSREVAGENRTNGAIDQAVDCGFSVMVIVDSARRARGGVSDEIKTQTDRVKALLLGWQHPEASRACEFAGGQLASVGARACTWEVRFRTRYHLRKVS